MTIKKFTTLKQIKNATSVELDAILDFEYLFVEPNSKSLREYFHELLSTLWMKVKVLVESDRSVILVGNTTFTRLWL